MKKSAVLSLLMMIASLFLFTSCAQNPSFSGEFSSEELIYSIGQEVDFFDELKLSGVSKDDVEFSFSNDLVLKTNNLYRMTKAGSAILSAKKDDLILATTKLVVKDKFKTPKNLTINENGVITWDAVVGVMGSQVYLPDSYTVVINGVLHNDVRDTKFGELNEGVYSVEVKANGIKYFEESEFASLTSFEYRHMASATNINLSASNSISSNMMLSWDCSQVGNFDVIINGVMVARGINSKSIELDFTKFPAGAFINASIIVNDNANKIYSSKTDFVINKPYSLSIQPIIENNNGVLRWREVEGATKYFVEYTNLSTGVRAFAREKDLIKDNGYVYYYLTGAEKGIYNLRVQAKGGLVNGRLYTDSSIESISNITKLEMPSSPEFSYHFTDTELVLDFVRKDGIDKVLVEINGAAYGLVDVSRDVSYSILLSEIAENDFSINVRAVPTIEQERVISSDENIIQLYRIGEILNLSHSLDGENSVLTFDKIQNADNYQVKINDVEITDFEKDEIFDAESNVTKIVLTIPNLSRFTPVNNAYNFEIAVSRQDGKSNIVKQQKTITILGKPNKIQDRTDGLFDWSSLAESGVRYDYTIYSSNSMQEQGGIVKSNSTNGTTIKPEDKLEYGYYIIKVEAKSENTDKYLDSDFGGFVENYYLQEFFHVEKRILTPKLILEERKDGFYLKFSSQEFAGKYLVYLDEQLLPNGTIVPSIQEEYHECPIPSLFPYQEDPYILNVVACVGDDGDSILHPNSEKGELKVFRLALPEFTSNNDDGDEKLVVKLPTGAKKVEIKEGERLLNQDGSNQISLKDLVGLSHLTFKFVAEERKENSDVMYLDSALNSFDFSRLDTPTNLSYSNGQLEFLSPSHEHTAVYKILVTLVNSANGNKLWETETTQTSFDLNGYVESMRTNPEFMSDYANCSQVLISVKAYNFDFQEDVFYLPSSYSAKLAIEKLDSPVITFNVENSRLSWNKVEKEGLTTYSIYVDGGKYNQDDITGLFEDLGDLDYLQGKEIVVFAENSRYLSSAYSNKIIVRELGSIDSVTISGNLLLGNISSNNLNQTKELLVNNSPINFDTQSGSFQIPLTENVHDFAIRLVAKSEENIGGVTYYYISSKTKNYKLISLESGSEIAVKDNEKISWPALAQEFSGNLSNPLSYTLTLFAGENQLQTFDKQTQTQILFEDPRIFNRQAGDYRLKVEGLLDSYILSAQEQNAIGYYGKKDLGTISYKKLAGIQEFSYSVKNSSGNLIAQRLNGDVVASWTDLWSDSENTMFDIDIDLSEFPEEYASYKDMIAASFKNLKNGSRNDDSILGALGFTYSLELKDGKYIFTLGNKIADLVFSAGTTEFPIFVHSEGNVNSTLQNLTFKRLYAPSNANISGDGILSFTPSNHGNRYVVSIKINEGETQYFETTQTSVDIMTEYIKDTTGSYYISVLADDTTGEYLPARTLLEFEGRRLQGVTDIYVQENGDVAITVADEGESQGLIFVASFKGEEKTFTPRPDDSQANVYHYSTVEFISLFGENNFDTNFVEINLSVRLEGKINSIKKPFTFGYNMDGLFTLEQKREVEFEDGKLLTDKSKNYLIITENIDITTGLWIEYHYFEIPESEDENPEPQERIVKIPLSTSSIKGWWVTTAQGDEYFTTAEPTGATAIKCFALNVDQTLADLKDGDYTFFISRICKDGDLIIQYGTSKITYSKLPAIDDSQVRLNNETLVWHGSEDTRSASYYLNLYTRENGEYKFFSKREVTSTTNFDLTQLISDTTKTFYLTITSLPSLDRYDLLPSCPSAVFTLQRHSAPVKLENWNGTLQFNLDSIRNMQLLKDIENNYTDYKKLAPIIARSTYSEPFNFSVSRGNITSANVRLKFAKVVDGKENESYYITVKATDLLAYELNNLTFTDEGQHISYLNTLINLSSSDTIEPSDREVIRRFVQDLQSSKFGLANSRVLFDDYGRHIPSGNYNVYVRQDGVPFDAVNREGVIPSEYSSSIFLNVAPAPDIILDREGNSGVYNYYLYFRPVDIQSFDGNQTTSSQALTYKLNLRVGADIKEFDIVNLDGNWQLQYQNDGEEGSSFALDANKMTGYVAIDLSRDFSRKISNLNDKVWDATIYAVGNDFTLNSKTNQISIELLDFDYQSLRLDNGMLSWTSGSENGTRVSYKAKNSTPDVLPVIAGKGSKNLKLPYAGQYEYVIFMACGGISQNSVVVDSESYKLENLYVRTTPDVEIVDGNFVLKNKGNEDRTFANFTQFNVTNNIAKRNNLWTKTNKIEDVNQEIHYVPGATEEFGQTELEATRFEFTSAGNSIELLGEHKNENHFTRTRLTNDANNADYILNINENSTTTNLLLESNSVVKDGKMLPSSQNPRIKDGDLVWDDITLSSPLEEDKQVVYKVTVYYYRPSETKKEIFYTSENKFDCKLISDDRDYNNYSISVTTIASDMDDIDNRSSIKFADGSFVLTSKEEVFGDKTLTKLNAPESISVSGNQFVIRYYPQDGDIINKEYVSKDTISFKLFDRNSGAEILGSLHGLNSSGIETKNFIVGTIGKGDSKIYYIDAYFLPEDGQFVYEKSGSYYISAYAYRVGSQESLENAQLISHPTVLPEAVYKLKDIQEDDLDFEYNIENGDYTLSFEDYFEKYRIGGRKDVIKVEILLESGDNGLTIDVTSAAPIITLKVLNSVSMPQINNTGVVELPEGTKISFNVLQNEDAPTPLLILGSDTCFNFTLNKAEFGASDEVNWNEESNHVYWSSTIDVIGRPEAKAYQRQEYTTGEIFMQEIENLSFVFGQRVTLLKDSEIVNGEKFVKIKYDGQDVYLKQSDLTTRSYIEINENGQKISREYLVVVYFNDGTSETSNIIRADTPEKLIYQPSKNGTITCIKVYVKDGKFSLFSNPIENNNEFDYRLFDSGTGLQDDPYIIANQKQFKNIALRNSSSDSFYFKLKNDITLVTDENSGFIINAPFYGNLDCNGKTITLELNDTSTIERVTHTFLPATETKEYRFSRGCGLFTSVEIGGRISNLKLKVKINLTNIDASTTITPIAVRNSGVIENVEIIEINSAIALSNLDVNIALAGLVDTNYNTIQNVQNNADVQLSANGDYIPNIFYAGVAIQNERVGFDSATIQNCINNGQILLLARTRQDGAKLMSAGIVGVVVNGAQVLNCGNNGNITLRGQGVSDFDGYAGGIALKVSSGEYEYSSLENCFNNGVIAFELQSGTTIQTLSSDNIAGIAHTVQGETNLTGLVDTAKQKLVVTCSSSVVASGCYASVSVQNLPNASLSETQTHAVNGLRVEIKAKQEGGFIASLVQA